MSVRNLHDDEGEDLFENLARLSSHPPIFPGQHRELRARSESFEKHLDIKLLDGLDIDIDVECWSARLA
jgi:hypothetical protein